MKFTGLIIAFIIFSGNFSFAETSQKLKIEEAIVFLSGAQLVSTASINLAKGENEYVFTNVASDVNNQSLSISATNGVVVESATFSKDYLAAEVLSPRVKALKDSIELVTEERQRVADKITMGNEQYAIIQANYKVGGNANGLSVAELQKMLDLANNKMEVILSQKNKNTALEKKLDELLEKMNKQLDEEHNKGLHPGGQLAIKFYANDATASNITITYIVANASWAPTYDIRVDDITQPVKLYYKANITQKTGVRWDNVKLSLSTGNPNEGVQAPEMNPWYLAFYIPRSAMVRSYKMELQNSAPSAVVAGKAMARAKDESTMNDYVTTDNSGINTTFDIDLPYTIPSDGQKHLVAIKKYDVPASYRYFAVPKLDKDAFLQAQLTNWEALNLLPGKSNVFYEGTYVGQGTLDVHNVKDTFTVSLGRDKKVIVKRDRDVKFRSIKTIGTNVHETYAYTISVRNTRKEKISLTVQDQQPVSNDKDIELEDIETGGSEYDQTTGLMKWNLQVNPNETQNLKFGFTIKYPKGRSVDNMPK